LPKCPICYDYPFEGERCPICGFTPNPQEAVWWKVVAYHPLTGRRLEPRPFSKKEYAKIHVERLKALGYEARYFPAPYGKDPSIESAFQVSSIASLGRLKVAYPLPTLPVETYPIEEQKYIAGLISGEGSFLPHVVRGNAFYDLALPPTERLYTYNYVYPEFGIGMNDFAEMFRVAEALSEYLEPTPISRPPFYLLRVPREKAIAIALWGINLWTKNSRIWQDAHRTITLWKEKVSIHVTPEIAREIIRQPRGKKLEYMIELKDKGMI